MVDSLATVGSIALVVAETLTNLSSSVSGQIVNLTEAARINVQNYANTTISSDNIPEAYQYAILNFSMANVLESDDAITGGDNVRLGDLSISEGGTSSADAYRKMAENSLKYVGRGIRSKKVLV